MTTRPWWPLFLFLVTIAGVVALKRIYDRPERLAGDLGDIRPCTEYMDGGLWLPAGKVCFFPEAPDWPRNESSGASCADEGCVPVESKP